MTDEPPLHAATPGEPRLFAAVAEEPRLFASVADDPPLFTSTIEQPRRRSGLSIWFAAAASLVVGILIGFASGYRAGQGTDLFAPFANPAEPRSAAPTSGSAPESTRRSGSERTFSESSVAEPVRVEPDPIVPTPPTPEVPEPASKQPAPAPEKPAPAESASRAAAPRRSAPPRTPPVQVAAASGPGTIRVLSRPAGAQVIFDGRVVGKTPLEIGAVPPGAHNVRLELPGFNRWETTVDVKPGSESRVAGTLEEP